MGSLVPLQAWFLNAPRGFLDPVLNRDCLVDGTFSGLLGCLPQGYSRLKAMPGEWPAH